MKFMDFKVGDIVAWTYTGCEEYSGTGKIVAEKFLRGEYMYFIEHSDDLGIHPNFPDIITPLPNKYYLWVGGDCEGTLKLVNIKDSKLARRLYKNQIEKIENGLIHLK